MSPKSRQRPNVAVTRTMRPDLPIDTAKTRPIDIRSTVYSGNITGQALPHRRSSHGADS